MKTNRKKSLLVLLSVIALAVFIGCSDDKEEDEFVERVSNRSTTYILDPTHIDYKNQVFIRNDSLILKTGAVLGDPEYYTFVSYKTEYFINDKQMDFDNKLIFETSSFDGKEGVYREAYIPMEYLNYTIRVDTESKTIERIPK